MLVRPATPADVDDIVRMKLALVATSWSDDPAFLDAYPDYAGRVRERLLTFLDDPGHHHYLMAVDDDGRPLGCMSASVSYHLPGPDWAGVGGHLSDLFVEPEARGQGVAKALMERAMDWERAQGAGWVELHATRMARDMYRKLGWTTREPEPEDAMFVSMHYSLMDEDK